MKQFVSLFSNRFAASLILVFLTQCNSPSQLEKGMDAQSSDSSAVLSISEKAAVAQSEITCPACGKKSLETMPTDICLIKYTCKVCKTNVFPKAGDCCVFCSYGTEKCPSMQEEP